MEAQKSQGVRVFGINPSPTRSDRMQTMLQQQAEKKWGDAQRWMELTQALPFGRMAEPDEIAHLAVFGASPASGVSSTSGAATSKGRRRRDSNSRR